jgi:UDP-hydrolysing UDP-N-acetyl-D-glucosamine 2-epimerase
MRTIGVVSVGRSDYGLLRPVVRRIAIDPALSLCLYVTGGHLLHGTVAEIERDGVEIAERVEPERQDDSPEGVALTAASVTAGFARVFSRRAPDILLVLGDRFEMHAAALAALPFGLPVAHVHGGETSEGAIDESLRHGITKLSHLHFASAVEHARRVVQLGEEPWRVTVTGAPGLDTLREVEPLSRPELSALLGIPLDDGPLLITYHSVTLQHDRTSEQVAELLAALELSDRPLVFTAPNADTNGTVIRKKLEEFVQSRPRSVLVESLGAAAYAGMLSCAAAMVGNSSSGLIEAPSFELPVVNVGIRQRGRLRAPNVVDADDGRTAIRDALDRALDPAFRKSLAGLANPYGDGRAAERIVARLLSVELGPELTIKRFHDLDALAS